MSNLDRHLSEARLAGIPLRVSVELGRFEKSLADAVSMQPGETVALSQSVSDPVGIYVDGLLYGRGRLVSAGGSWSVELEEVLVDSKPDFLSEVEFEAAEQAEVSDLEG